MNNSFWKHTDLILILIYILLVSFGAVNIFSAESNELTTSVFDFSKSHGKQLIWIVVSLALATGIMLVDARFYITFSWYFYGIMMVLLVVTMLVGKEVKGATSWLEIGGFTLQTSEFAKFAAILAIARYLDGFNVSLDSIKTRLICGALLLLPIALVILQNDFGTALVFAALVLMLFREGLPAYFLLIPVIIGALFIAVLLVDKIIVISLLVLVGLLSAWFLRANKQFAAIILLFISLAIGLVFGVDYTFNNVLKPHQRTRVNVLIGLEDDLQGAGYNVHQSLIAIGSGGFDGKGFRQGTQTTGGFVPEQTTDFIFCTVGEEYGWLGTSFVIILFLALFIRIIQLAERQKSRFARVYGYGVLAVIFFHFFVNIAMTIGLFPVIGIPLPFFSYGGSSLMGFTILLFIFVKLDAGLKYYFD